MHRCCLHWACPVFRCHAGAASEFCAAQVKIPADPLRKRIGVHDSTKVPYGAMAAQMLVLSLQLLHLTGVSGVACFSSRLCQTAQLLFALLLLVQSHRDTMFDMCL